MNWLYLKARLELCSKFPCKGQSRFPTASIYTLRYYVTYKFILITKRINVHVISKGSGFSVEIPYIAVSGHLFLMCQMYLWFMI